MKKLMLITAVLIISFYANAKKVKFEVDMTDQTISTYGVHVAGDFQALAGYTGGDWQPGTTEMDNEPGTQIYSVIVDIPAFAKYEYKFLNGDQWYDVEFVPWESRIGYNFNDNRWIFVDSIVNDTTTTFPILYGGNAPAGLKLLRFKVDLQKEPSINSEGIHVAGSFQGWNPMINRLYDFDTTIYEYMAYIEPGYIEYKYYNGNNSSAVEIVPSECSVNGNRWIDMVNDTVLDVVCFAECQECLITRIPAPRAPYDIGIYPNPAFSELHILFYDKLASHNVSILDVTGMVILEYKNYSSPEMSIDLSKIDRGVYLIKSRNVFNHQTLHKFVKR